MTPMISRDKMEEHFDQIAPEYDKWKQKNAYYYDTLKFYSSRIVKPGSSVLEVGCGTGEILAAMRPGRGVGIDISSEMIKIASKKFPRYEFIHGPIEKLDLDEKFDYILLIDVIDHVDDIMNVFKQLYKFCHENTQIIVTMINPWWEPILMLAEKMGAKMPEGRHNFLEMKNLAGVVELMDFKVNYSGYMLLFPKYVPLLSYICNALLVKIWGIRRLSSTQFMTIQPKQKNTTDLGMGCSVIIPCFNEEGNMKEAVERVPDMGTGTEIIVVDDGSTDGTADEIKKLQKDFSNLKLVSYSPNRGKGHAVKAGFDAATNEIIMILDADISTTPEELPRFFDPLNKGLCQFVNGTRMVYPMQDQAMRLLNYGGNKLFGSIMTFIVGQRLTDTLCGTKALYKTDFQRMEWGKDKWGDFDLLFGAAKMGSKIMELPVHYLSRKSGESKMKRFRHCIHLLNACIRGFFELVLIPPKEFYEQKGRTESHDS